MKTLFIFLTVVCFLSVTFSPYAQTGNNHEPQEIKEIDGSEIFDFSNRNVITSTNTDNFAPVQGDFFAYNIHLISSFRKTGYDFQSNACPQQVWLDLNSPSFLHAVFTHSNVADGTWFDRSSLYFGSTNAGINWFELGQVPINNGSTGRSGFPAIYGTSTGRAVIANHNNSEGTSTHSKVFIDDLPFEYNFSTFDPGIPAAGLSIWPRITLLPNDIGVLASSINAADVGFYINTWSGGVFSGWQFHDGDQAETYSLAVSNAGMVGLAYLGQSPDDGDVFYKESTDGGLNWTAPLKIWDAVEDPGTGDFLGCLRGISISFYGEQPCIVFELGWMTITGYYPQRESEIRFWSPNVNSGVANVIADSSNVPFYPNKGTADVFFPISRPVIGRSQSFNHLFVAFSATSGEYWPGSSNIDSTSYYAGFFIYTPDGGNNWTLPEKFTPQTPLRDWRYISIAPINPVSNNLCTVHMVAQVDSVPGSNINASPPMPVSVTAQYYHISTVPILVPVELVSFTARLNEQNVILNWQTATETNNQGFEIQRKIMQSNTESDWEIIGFTAGKGTTTEPQSYSFSDDVSKLYAISFVYRLKQIDFDGSFEFSEEILVEYMILPKEYELLQNYPNPFNPITTIYYSLKERGTVLLKIFNALGKEIKTLVKEQQDAGTYKLEFDASSLSSGIYFYVLKTGEFTATKKMVLIR